MIKMCPLGALGPHVVCARNVFTMCPLGIWAIVPSVTLTSGMMPYLVQSSSGSSSRNSNLACLRVHKNAPKSSKFPEGAVQLNRFVSERQIPDMTKLPRTPPGNNAGDESLFWVIGNVRANTVDGTPKVAIGAAYNIECLRVSSHRT